MSKFRSHPVEGEEGPGDAPTAEDLLDEALEETFPASDPISPARAPAP